VNAAVLWLLVTCFRVMLVAQLVAQPLAAGAMTALASNASPKLLSE
jgi:hypothetical protein